MAITFKNKVVVIQTSYPRKKQAGHTMPKKPEISLDEPGRIRIAHFQDLLGGLSHSAFDVRRRLGLVPPYDGRDPRPYWNTQTVKKFLQG